MALKNLSSVVRAIGNASRSVCSPNNLISKICNPPSGSPIKIPLKDGINPDPYANLCAYYGSIVDPYCSFFADGPEPWLLEDYDQSTWNSFLESLSNIGVGGSSIGSVIGGNCQYDRYFFYFYQTPNYPITSFQYSDSQGVFNTVNFTPQCVRKCFKNTVVVRSSILYTISIFPWALTEIYIDLSDPNASLFLVNTLKPIFGPSISVIIETIGVNEYSIAINGIFTDALDIPITFNDNSSYTLLEVDCP